MEWPHSVSCNWQKYLANTNLNQPNTCPQQSPSKTRLRTLPSTSSWSYEKPFSFWTHHCNKLFSLNLHCYHSWKTDWLDRTPNWKHFIYCHSPKILAYTNRTTWSNAIRTLHLHWCWICLYIIKIHHRMQQSWHETWSSCSRTSINEWYLWSQMVQSPQLCQYPSQYCPTWRCLLPSCTCLCNSHHQLLPSQECHWPKWKPIDTFPIQLWQKTKPC